MIDPSLSDLHTPMQYTVTYEQPIAKIATFEAPGISAIVTPSLRTDYRIDFGRRISHLLLTEQDALRFANMIRQQVIAARKARQTK